MDIFGVGSMEILTVLIVGFLVLGPNRVLGLARELGKVTREIRNATQKLSQTTEMDLIDTEENDDSKENR